MTAVSANLKKVNNRFRKGIALIPLAFDFENYHHSIASVKLSVPTNKPIIGYIGGINYRLDFKLLLRLIKSNPNWNFAFVGPYQNDEQDAIFDTQKYYEIMKSFKNFYHINHQIKESLSAYIRQFNIGIIPYNISNPFNRYCYPVKLFEYFYYGKPVISTPILELDKLNPLVKIAKDYTEFNKYIHYFINNGWPRNYQIQQKLVIKGNTWERRTKKIITLLTDN